MSSVRAYGFEAIHELRQGLRGSLVPLMFVGLVGYVFMMLVNADYLRDMGAADVPRNSPLIVFQMTSGQAFWLIFAWAWVFAQVVTRDRAASLHEIVLTTGVSLRGLMVARYLGALLVALVLGASSSVALAAIPLLGRIGVLPPEAIGPTPWLAIAFGWLLFVLPTAIGLGALYLSATLLTRRSAGAFGAAAVVIFLWMVAMVVLRGGGLHVDVATLMDVSGFGEAEHQTKYWTPHEKATSLLSLTTPLIINRLVWTLAPLALFGLVLARLRREQLVLDRSAGERPVSLSLPSTMPAQAAEESASATPSWLRASMAEAMFHLARATRGWAFTVCILLWTVINVVAPFVHMTGHREGPLEPRPELLAPFLVDLCYVFSVFIVAGFVGGLVRQDHHPGFDEMLDVSPAPLRVRVLGSAVAAVAITLVLALTPTLAAWLVMALRVPYAFDVIDPLLVNGLVAAPALLELCALTFLVHSLVRSPGTAHALSMLSAFVAIVNHEVAVVTYPPAQVGIPVHIELGAATGWAPWLATLLGHDALKVSILLAFVALAWLLYPRGTDLTLRARSRAALMRLRGSAGALLGVAVLSVFGCLLLLHEQLVARGHYASKEEEEAEAAAWEASGWTSAARFTLRGGDVTGVIDPASQTVAVQWVLRGLETPDGRLQAELGEDMRVRAARIGDVAQRVDHAHDRASILLPACVAAACDLTLELEVTPRGLPSGARRARWLHASGAWIRAIDILPRLGLARERALRAPQARRAHGLPERLPDVPTSATAAVVGVAPPGHWRWTLQVRTADETQTISGARQGALDFAITWRPTPFAVRGGSGITVSFAPEHAQVAHEIEDDARAMLGCLTERLGIPASPLTVVQVPRGLGPIAMHGDKLWLPEDEGWDVGPGGTGRALRRAAIARAWFARWISDRAALRDEPGSQLLTAGLGGWAGLECVRSVDGRATWLTLMARASERAAEQFGALEAPIRGLADDEHAGWVERYAPLATFNWAQVLGPEKTMDRVRAMADMVRRGVPVREATAQAIGSHAAQALLGPPFASDVQVIGLDTGTPSVRGIRAGWQNGGWQDMSRSFDVVHRFDDVHTPPRVMQVPASIEANAGFVALDAWPSFERSPRDNAWPAAGTR